MPSYSTDMGNKSRFGITGFTLVEIMVVIAIICVLAAIAIPGLVRARKRAQATQVKNDLRLIEAAIDQYAIDTNKSPGTSVAVPDWTPYIKDESRLSSTGKDVLGHDYGPQTVDQMPVVPPQTAADLGDVVDHTFWEPFSG